MADAPVLAIDIGGSKLAVALVSGADVLAQATVPTPAAEGPEAVLAAVVEAGRRLLVEAPAAPIAVGVASAGVVSEGRVRAMSPELLPGWNGFPLVARLQEEFLLPVAALNDAQAAALGEHLYGAGRGRDSLLFVTVSTGVGGGLVLGGRLWQGASGLAGHLGHVRGGRLERRTSGTALARRAAEAGFPADARQVVEAADSGRPWARQLLAEAAEALVDALVDVKVLVDPEVVVLGGGVGLNPSFRREVNEASARLDERLRIEVRAAELGAAAGLVGAARWAVRRLEAAAP